MIEKAYLAAKAAGVVALVTASMCGPAAMACDVDPCGRPAITATNSNVSVTPTLPGAAGDEAADIKRVAWVTPSHERPANSRANLVFVADKREVFNGCTQDQMTSMKGSVCIAKASDDVVNSRPLSHIIVCKGTEIVCCLQDGHLKFSQCEPMGGMAPPKPDVVCSTLSSAKGVWQADPKSIKAGSDKHNCTQVYTCTPPLPRELSENQNKCNAVVSVSNKQVTQNGTCEPGNGSCTACRTNPPNDPCLVSFRK
jgi:hypothetical protein